MRHVSESLPSFTLDRDDDDDDEEDDDVVADAAADVTCDPAKMLRRHLGCFLLNYVKNAYVMTMVRKLCNIVCTCTVHASTVSQTCCERVATLCTALTAIVRPLTASVIVYMYM